MATATIEHILTEVRNWPIHLQIELARELDRLTAKERWDAVGRKVHQRACEQPLDEGEVNTALQEVRRVRPLHRRCSTQERVQEQLSVFSKSTTVILIRCSRLDAVLLLDEF
ncbi:MAG: hypothetical protein HY318_14510 [Armatimonadetes bacterium]|nr:hypothetical protein [Armatimonadota bacterium]